MSSTLEERVRVCAKQHGGEKTTYGDDIATNLVQVEAEDGELAIIIYVGRERRSVVWVDIPIEVIIDKLPDLWDTHPKNQDDE